MLVNLTPDHIDEIVLVADFGKDGGKHGEYRRAAAVSDLRLGLRELTAPAFNRVGMLNAISAEVERIDHFLKEGELPKELPSENGSNDSRENESYVAAMRAAAMIAAWTPDAALDRKTKLQAEGQRIWESIQRDQAKGEWVDYTQVRLAMNSGVPWLQVLDKLPELLRRVGRECLASAAGRQWLHNEAINGNTMDYSRNPEMALVAPNPMGVGKVRSKHRSRHTDDVGE